MKLNKKELKDLYILACLFILPLLFIYLFFKLIFSYLNKEKMILDQYMYDLIKYDVVYNKKSFLNAVLYHEKRIIYHKTKWCFRLLIISTLILVIIFKNEFVNFILNGLNILPTFKWPTVYETNKALLDNNNLHIINLPENYVVSLFPIIIFKSCNFTSIVFCCSITYNLLLFICGFFIVRACLSTLSRLNRANKVTYELYGKKKFNKKNTHENYSNLINSPIPNHEKYQRKSRW